MQSPRCTAGNIYPVLYVRQGLIVTICNFPSVFGIPSVEAHDRERSAWTYGPIARSAILRRSFGYAIDF